VKALVTGGAGFIGSALVERLLAESHTVTVIDDLSSGSLANLARARTEHQGRLSFVRADVRSPELADVVARSRPDVVFHLAAQTDEAVSRSRPSWDAEVNIGGSVAVLDACRASGAAKLVFASDQRIYGRLRPAQLPAKESGEQLPVSPLGVAKKVVFDYLRAYRDEHNLEFTALVLAHVYGPEQAPDAPDAVVARQAAELVSGRPGEIRGDGARTLDLVFVDDAVDALARAADRGGGLLLNIGSGRETSIDALYAVMAAGAGHGEVPAHAPDVGSEPARMALDVRRAAIHLGWKPWTALADGVAAVLARARDRAAG
jgi:UDP-glucose 4-epimerase